MHLVIARVVFAVFLQPANLPPVHPPYRTIPVCETVNGIPCPAHQPVGHVEGLRISFLV